MISNPCTIHIQGATGVLAYYSVGASNGMGAYTQESAIPSAYGCPILLGLINLILWFIRPCEK